jgi:hypothetical protein
MTPKEKASELVHKYIDLTNGWVYGIESWKHKKKCALIAVDEVMKNNSFPTMDWWLEVKQEIENL